MKYYCECVSAPLAEKLKEKGMPMTLWQNGNNTDYIEVLETRQEIFDESQTYEIGVRFQLPTYAEVFDWLMGMRYVITIRAVYFLDGGLAGWQPHYNHWGLKKCDTWYQAANAAIEKALTLF